MDNKESLLKYGVELLSFAIKEHNLELIDCIHKKCINYFKEDLQNNKMLLSVITSTISLLNEYYPEYTLKYSLETSMIIDSHSYNIEHQNNSLHLYSQNLQIIDLSQSILWSKYLISGFSLEQYTNNNPWNLAPTYSSDGTMDPNPFIIQPPNENTNMFTDFGSDSSALSNWSYLNNPTLRRWETWFLEVIYYYANADKTREEIRRLIKSNDQNKINLQQVIKEELKEPKEELKQILLKESNL
ncbi:hypothetical protein C1645_827750 [Glomus cerebriforme]|uniref:Uncharacterized protein n=1 Tax=Glomus cerebriforme TaxID=658196 RepID=A0A397SX46_9GLOM|nr:hypothetical protein C1645_827750 [Glomus cerebriforme]